jgi:lysyl-tRNA synthetase class 2
VIVKNYPLSQAALARRAEDDQQCAARFELFAAGLELANGYDELRDEDALVARFRRNDQRRVAAGRKAIGRQNRALERAISSGLPPCTGVALGVDRLLMVRTGKRAICDVIPFTIDFA